MAVKKSEHWKGAPNTNSKAVITKLRKVKDKLVIEVTKAHIRNAEVKGVFELANSEMPFRIKKGVLTVEVICLWHGKKPKTTWTHLTLGKKYELVAGYTGEVVANIGNTYAS
jgi:predicted transcriptional regulator